LGNSFVDTAIYDEAFSKFIISKNNLVTDTGEAIWTIGSSISGNDTLVGIEIVKFADRTERLKEQEILRDTDNDGVDDLKIIQGTLEDNQWALSDEAPELQSLKLFGGAGNDSAILANIANTVFDDLGVNHYTGGNSSKDVFVAQNGSWEYQLDVMADGIAWDVKVSDVNGNITYLNNFERLELAGEVFNLKTTSSIADRNGDGVEDIVKIFGSDGNNIDNQALSASFVLGEEVHVGSRLEIYGNKGDDKILGSNNVTNILSGGEGDDQLIGGDGSKDIALMDGKFEDYEQLVVNDGVWSITHSDTHETDTLTNIDFIKFVDRIESLQIQTDDYEVFSIDSGIQTITKLTGTNFDDNIAVTVSDDKVIKTNGGSDTIVVAEGFSGKVQITDFDEDFDTLSLVLNNKSDDNIASIRGDGDVFSFETSEGGDVILNGQDAPYAAVSFKVETNTDTVLLVDGSAITSSVQYVFDDMTYTKL